MRNSEVIPSYLPCKLPNRLAILFRYQGTTLDAISKTQTQIKLVYVGHFLAWFAFLFMVHTMNRPQRGVSSWVLLAFVLVTIYAVFAGFVLRKRLFKQSAEAFPSNLRKALGLWRAAHFMGFSFAMSITTLGLH